MRDKPRWNVELALSLYFRMSWLRREDEKIYREKEEKINLYFIPPNEDII